MRRAKIERKTKETQIYIDVNLDGNGKATIDTPLNFLNHLLTLLSYHSLIDVNIKAQGDLKHHLVEDLAITLGSCIDKALGEREGISRYGFSIVPMDEALALVSLDLVKRSNFFCEMDLKRENIEDLASEDLLHFLSSLASNINCTLHIKILRGNNDHHVVEAVFKALALAFREAISPEKRTLPSSKGVM
ncbi:MAG: imidazoleglycerol-phosphate dehydratase HisB [Nitrososphaerales archaeon]